MRLQWKTPNLGSLSRNWGEGRMRHGGREGSAPPLHSREDKARWGRAAGPRQLRVLGGQRASVPPFPVLSHLLFPIQLMAFSSRGGDPAHLTPLQSRIWPSGRLARGHAAHTVSFHQVRGKPEMDPPSNTTSSQTLLGPKSTFAPPRATPRAPPAAGELELGNKHRHPLSHRHPPPFQTARGKNKIKKTSRLY